MGIAVISFPPVLLRDSKDMGVFFNSTEIGRFGGFFSLTPILRRDPKDFHLKLRNHLVEGDHRVCHAKAVLLQFLLPVLHGRNRDGVDGRQGCVRQFQP